MEYYSNTTTITVLLLIVSLTTSIALIPCSAETNDNNTLCIETEKQALLAFKKSLEDPSHILSSWNDSNGRDCCAWEYVVCDHLTSHVREIHLRSPNWDSGLGGMISPSLLNLKDLAYLDLSWNNFSGLEIPSFVGSMKSLEHLDLSYSHFQGNIPYNFRNLSSLRTLDLSELLGGVDNIKSLSGLVSLEYLGLDYVNLRRASSWLEVVNELPNLIELHLSDCNLDHFPPDPVRLNFTSLEVLDLSYNYFDSPVPSWIFNLSNLVSLDLGSSNLRGPIPSDKNMGRLRFLDLSWNNFNCTLPYWLFNSYSLDHVVLRDGGFYGAVPNTIGNLSSLRILDLSENKFSGKIMWRIGNICSLQKLDISINEFEGDFSDVFGSRMSECCLASLSYLDVSWNGLSGELTERVGEFQRLRYLNLARNSFTGSIPLRLGNVSSLDLLELNHNKFVGNIPPSLGLLLNLSDLDLGHNKLVGNIPSSFGQLSNLESLSLDNNMLEGIVTENHFSNLNKLTHLSASENSLTLSVREDWHPPFQLEYMDLGSWILGSKFPSWVQTQTGLDIVSLANTGISGEIPTWFWSLPNLTSFDLSQNHLSGELPHLISISNVWLSSNNLSGPLPLISGSTRLLDLSNNSLLGGIARTLCIANKNHVGGLKLGLTFLHLGGNDLSGEIPDCWMNWPWLVGLNLGNNNFIGKIPASFGLLDRLRSLNLYNNSLSGEVPFSLQNCTKLTKIDLSGNKLEGINIISPPPNLRVVILRSNYFSGQIAPEICTMRHLQVFDVARNSFSGGIPTCLDNLTFMSSQNEQANNNPLLSNRVLEDYQYSFRYIESASLTTKGQEQHYDTILPLFSIIDLSSNRLSGSIPKELTGLAGLRSLNLSGNYLSGSIPDNIGDMASLESLDLSGNDISGEIPIGLARLTALNYLDLSYNDLSGRIPTSSQLQTFSPSSFIGNNMCGLPLSDKCDEKNNSPPPEKNEEASEIDMWFYVCMSFGFTAGFWVWWSALIFKESWRYAYFELLDDWWNIVVCGFCVS